MRRAAALTLISAAVLASTVPARAETSRAGAWEWRMEDGRRIATVFGDDGDSFSVRCPAQGTEAGTLVAWTGGQQVRGRARLKIDGAEARSLPFRSGAFAALDDRARKRFDRMVKRLREGSRLILSWGDGVEARFSLDGSAEAIGRCK